MIKNILFALILLFIFSSHISAQEITFGKVSKKELEETLYSRDTTAKAVVLYKKRDTHYEFDEARGWILVTEVHERIKLFKKDGFEHATKKIGLYIGRDDEKLSIKAYTYNLKNGKVEKTKLEKGGIFNENISDTWSSKNFTLPNLSEGCIVEWKYTISSPYVTNITDVICQYDIPIEQLEIKIHIPERFEFRYTPSRYYPVKVKQSLTQKTYHLSSKARALTHNQVSQGRAFSSNLSHENVKLLEKTYVAQEKNIPALTDEPYVNNINNYRAKINFEIAAYRPKNEIPKLYNTTWEDVTKSILNNSNFGGQIDKKSHFKNDLDNILTADKSQVEKIALVFNFVKSKMRWNEMNRLYVSNDGIKKAYNDGVGNSSEINLTLVAMLREAGIKANPVLISTRSHGIPL